MGVKQAWVSCAGRAKCWSMSFEGIRLIRRQNLAQWLITVSCIDRVSGHENRVVHMSTGSMLAVQATSHQPNRTTCCVG